MKTAFVRSTVAPAFACVLASCSSTSIPRSSLEFGRPSTDAINHYPVQVTGVDFLTVKQGNFVAIEPGRHWISVETEPVRGSRWALSKAFLMYIEPCTQYYVAAQKAAPLLPDWSLVVESTVTVADCDPQVELERAAARRAGRIMPAASSPPA